MKSWNWIQDGPGQYIFSAVLGVSRPTSDRIFESLEMRSQAHHAMISGNTSGPKKHHGFDASVLAPSSPRPYFAGTHIIAIWRNFSCLMAFVARNHIRGN